MSGIFDNKQSGTGQAPMQPLAQRRWDHSVATTRNHDNLRNGLESLKVEGRRTHRTQILQQQLLIQPGANLGIEITQPIKPGQLTWGILFHPGNELSKHRLRKRPLKTGDQNETVCCRQQVSGHQVTTKRVRDDNPAAAWEPRGNRCSSLSTVSPIQSSDTRPSLPFPWTPKLRAKAPSVLQN